MRLVANFDPMTTDPSTVPLNLEGNSFSWSREYCVAYENGMIAIVALNIFERLAWTFEQLISGSDIYSKFTTIFGHRDIRVVSMDEIVFGPSLPLPHIAPPAPLAAAPIIPPVVVPLSRAASPLDSESPASILASPAAAAADPVPSVSWFAEQIRKGQQDRQITNDIKNHLENGRLDEAYDLLPLLMCGKDDFYIDLANAYFTQSNFERVLEILRSHINSNKSALRNTFATQCFNMGNVEYAIAFGCRSVDSNTLFRGFAISSCHLENYGIAERFLKEVPSADISEFFLYLAKSYPEGSPKIDNIILYMLSNRMKFSDLEILFKLGREHLLKGSLDMAERILIECKEYNMARAKRLLVELAVKHYENDNLEKALDYGNYSEDFSVNKTLHLNIASKYLSIDPSRARAILEDLIKSRHISHDTKEEVRFYMEKNDLKMAISILHSRDRHSN